MEAASIARLEPVSLPRTIADVMVHNPVAVRPEQPIAAAHSIMRSLGVHHLPVVEHGRVIGVVSQSDLRLLESLDPIDVACVPIEEAMGAYPYLVGPDEPLAEVLGRMLDRRIGSALVVHGGRLVGIFTTFDALVALRRLIAAHTP
jgi:acetoin utilization protein AcuB